MKYYIVTHDRQGGTFGMERAYTAQGWSEQAQEWCDADHDDEEIVDSWALSNYDSEEDLIADISEMWDLDFAEITEEQKETYENLLKEIDIAGTNFYSAELKHNVEDQKFYQKQYYDLHDKLYAFYEEVK